MNKTQIIQLKCPKCHEVITARLVRKRQIFMIYKCPGCNRNVAIYDGKVSILSDKLVSGMFKSGKLTFSGDIAQKSQTVITPEQIIGLKKILETEQDSSKIISLL